MIGKVLCLRATPRHADVNSLRLLFSARGFEAQRAGRTGCQTRPTAAQSADMGLVYAQGFDLGHAYARRGGAKSVLMPGHTGHLAGQAAAAEVSIH